MEYVVQAFKVLKNLVHAEANARAQKNWIFCRFPNPNTISSRDYQLILCMFGFLHSLEHEICFDPYFDPNYLNIVFSDSFLCASRF